jgi:hypothetical protein
MVASPKGLGRKEVSLSMQCVVRGPRGGRSGPSVCCALLVVNREEGRIPSVCSAFLGVHGEK